MATTASASRLQTFTVSDAVASTHGWPAIHPDGTLAVIYSQGAAPQTIKVQLYRPVESAGDEILYTPSGSFTLATPAGDVTPTAGASPSCSHPTICPIEDGFAYFYERRDTTIGTTTLTTGGMQIEMGKIEFEGSGYMIRKSATAGKGYVLDNTLIAGQIGGNPRCHWAGRGNIVGLVYGHQLTYTNVADDTQRTWDVRAAYLDFTPNGKPVFVTGGNRTGGSAGAGAFADLVDGNYAAGPTQTYLVNAVNLDADAAISDPYNAGGGLPHCVFDMRGDFAVAYESRQDKNGTGGIVMKIFKGPYRATGLDTAAIYTNTADFGATAGDAARRPILAFRSVAQTGLALTGTNYPPILLVYGTVDPDGGVVDTALAKTVTFPLNGAAPTVAAITIPANQNYDANADDQTLPHAVDSAFVSAVIVQERMVNTGGGDGYKFKIVHTDTALPGEIMFSSKVARPQRPNFQARTLNNGKKLAVLTYEGQEASGAGAEQVYMEMFQFA